MKATTFDQHHTQEILFYPENPVINILKIHFISTNKDWVVQIHNASLLVKISALGSHYKELASQEFILAFSTHIEPTHIQPVLTTDQSYRFSAKAPAGCLQWKVEITLRHLTFGENESVSVFYADTK